jgi:hypothetical protein
MHISNHFYKQKRKRLVQLAKKIGTPLKRRFLPLEGNHLFHSELGAVARRNKDGSGSSRPEPLGVGDRRLRENKKLACMPVLNFINDVL